MKKLTKFFLLTLLVLPQAAHAARLTNPLGTSDINVIIGNVVQVLLGLSGSVALLMFIWGGLLWLTSAGRKDQVKKGRDTLIWAGVGLVVIFSAYIVLRTLITLLGTQSITLQ